MTSPNPEPATPSPPRLRFAPSPTGPLHIGGARTAIYNWAAARAMGGAFILRIEDTDQARSKDEYLANILESFRWLGLDWDEGPEQDGLYGPYFQSQRLGIYHVHAAQLLESGHAYRCYCTPEEVDAGRDALRAAGQSPMYNRACRDLSDAQRAAHEAAGRQHSIRFRMPLDEDLEVDDLGKGAVTVNLREVDDWVMVRAGGMPLYNFACVVDDLLMQISHVVRGEEHFINGVKQIVMFRAMEQPAPRYAHIPLIHGKDGKKLSKRDASTALLDYRDQGYSPDAIFNYIALLGWSYSGEQDVFSRDEMVAKFDIADIGKSGARFDEEKLQWMAGDYLRRAAIGDLVAAVEPFLVQAGAVPAAAFASHPAWIANLVRCNQERIRLYTELAPKVGLFFGDQVEADAAAAKNLGKNEAAKQWLAEYADLLAASALPPSYPADRGAADTTVVLGNDRENADGELPDRQRLPFLLPAHLEADARQFAAVREIKFGHLVHPIRAALTGTDKGPGLFDVVYLLGKERCVARLRKAAAGA
jgi:glutamyl-tRNA synthetase